MNYFCSEDLIKLYLDIAIPNNAVAKKITLETPRTSGAFGISANHSVEPKYEARLNTSEE